MREGKVMTTGLASLTPEQLVDVLEYASSVLDEAASRTLATEFIDRYEEAHPGHVLGTSLTQVLDERIRRDDVDERRRSFLRMCVRLTAQDRTPLVGIDRSMPEASTPQHEAMRG